MKLSRILLIRLAPSLFCGAVLNATPAFSQTPPAPLSASALNSVASAPMVPSKKTIEFAYRLIVNIDLHKNQYVNLTSLKSTLDSQGVMEIVKSQAEAGNAHAQNVFAMAYIAGWGGVPQGYVQAASWYLKAAEQGVADAQFNMRFLYAHGQGVPQDYAKAVSWYRKAAEQGYADAQYNLGGHYANGQGVPQDYAKAASWLRKAAE